MADSEIIGESSNKSFGFLFSLLFFVVGIWPIFDNGGVKNYLLFIAFVLAFFSVFIPSVFAIPNKIWQKFGFFLASIFNPIVMLFLYLCAILPFGLFFRFRGKDMLNMEFDLDMKTYWISRTRKPESMKNQF